MAKIICFEEIEAWQKARELTREIYKICSKKSFARDFGLKDQIQRASVSSMSNIAEGFERGSNREFIQFLGIAKGSAGETKSLLYVAKDCGYINSSSFQYLYNLASQTINLIGGFASYLRKSDLRGPRFIRKN
jgi:four helix bundle protein